MKVKGKQLAGLLMALAFIFSIIIGYRYRQSYENAKYEFNRNCYYRLEGISIETENMIKELQRVTGNNRVSKESLMKLKYLALSIESAVGGLNLEVSDYDWKISKVKGFFGDGAFFGVVMNLYFDYIENTYGDNSYIDLKKEEEAIKYICSYYQGLKDIMDKGPEGKTFEEKNKADMIAKESWIDMTSSLNKFDKDFSEENRTKILANKK